MVITVVPCARAIAGAHSSATSPAQRRMANRHMACRHSANLVIILVGTRRSGIIAPGGVVWRSIGMVRSG
jgi:hypothetical protein